MSTRHQRSSGIRLDQSGIGITVSLTRRLLQISLALPSYAKFILHFIPTFTEIKKDILALMSRREVDFGKFTDCQPQNPLNNGRFLDHHTNVTSNNGS